MGPWDALVLLGFMLFICVLFWLAALAEVASEYGEVIVITPDGPRIS